MPVPLQRVSVRYRALSEELAVGDPAASGEVPAGAPRAGARPLETFTQCGPSRCPHRQPSPSPATRERAELEEARAAQAPAEPRVKTGELSGWLAGPPKVRVRIRVRVRVRVVIKPSQLSRYPLARKGILFGRNHKEVGCVFAGSGDLMAQALLSHFERSIRAALKLPK